MLQRRLDTGKAMEPGAVLRCSGVSAKDAFDETEPVLFLSAPYLGLKEKNRRFVSVAEDFESMSLLQSLYGYDVGDARESNQVFKSINRSWAKKTIHVPQLWCLLIGPSQ